MHKEVKKSDDVIIESKLYRKQNDYNQHAQFMTYNYTEYMIFYKLGEYNR